MQKNEKVYTFLLKRSSKTKIYIRRIEVSRRFVHLGSLGFFLIAGFTSISVGLSGMARSTVLAKNLDPVVMQAQIAAYQQQELDVIEKVPAAADYTTNSGGPEIVSPDSDDADIVNEINGIRKSSNAAFLPTMWAHLGKINNEFGFRRNPFGGRTYEFHPGMDINGERGDIVVAPANGTVVKAGWTGGYGNMVELDHGNGLTTRYGHLSKIEVEIGDSIQRGQLMGLIGSTGRSTGPHLHFELRLNDKAVNPRFLLPPEPTDLSKLEK